MLDHQSNQVMGHHAEQWQAEAAATDLNRRWQQQETMLFDDAWDHLRGDTADDRHAYQDYATS